MEPDISSALYRDAVRAQFMGDRKDSEGRPCPWWDHVRNNKQNPQVEQRLAAHCEQYEYTAALFINFPDNAGQDMGFWDDSACCACITSCRAFNCTVAEAFEHGWISRKPPDEVSHLRLAEVAMMVRSARNPVAHQNIDIDFNSKFDDLERVCLMNMCRQGCSR